MISDEVFINAPLPAELDSLYVCPSCSENSIMYLCRV